MDRWRPPATCCCTVPPEAIRRATRHAVPCATFAAFDFCNFVLRPMEISNAQTGRQPPHAAPCQLFQACTSREMNAGRSVQRTAGLSQTCNPGNANQRYAFDSPRLLTRAADFSKSRLRGRLANRDLAMRAHATKSASRESRVMSLCFRLARWHRVASALQL
jgi:hypothetical protein